MSNYLWKLSLSDIPLGWSSVYEEFLLNFPDGKNIEFSDIEGNVFKYWAHPVQYKSLIEHNFKKFSNEAKLLFKKRNHISFRGFTQQILELDVALYGLLFEWAFDRGSVEESPRSYDPYSYFSSKQYYNYNLYFSIYSYTNVEEVYGPLRIFNNGIPIKHPRKI